MGTYKIKDLEELTGIKAHTIRIWEKRYELFEPQRTDTNIRTYSETDLRKLLNIAVLYENGVKISKIAVLEEEALLNKVKEYSLEGASESSNNLFLAMLDFDENSIRKTLEQFYKQNSAKSTFVDLIIPLMKKIGVLWQVNAVNPIQEHFISNIIRDFIICKSSEIKVDENKGYDYVLFLHANETHELSLLFYNFILRAEGFKTMYLGCRVPDLELIKTLKQIRPKKVVSSFIGCVEVNYINNLFKNIKKALPEVSVIFGGYYIDKFKNDLDQGIQTVTCSESLYV